MANFIFYKLYKGMNIANNNRYYRPAFKTTIKIIPESKVKEIAKKNNAARIDSICCSICDPNPALNGIIKNEKNAFTDGVETCSAAVFVNKNIKETDVFAHINPKNETFEHFDSFEKQIEKPTNAIIIGSEGSASKTPDFKCITPKHSRTGELFKMLENIAIKRNIPVSCIGDMKFGSSASACYLGDTDELYLSFCNSFDNGGPIEASDLESLQKICNDIRIAEGDTLVFGDDAQDTDTNKTK